MVLYLDSMEYFRGPGELDFNRNGLQIGSEDFKG
jgi:hypothetical protein